MKTSIKQVKQFYFTAEDPGSAVIRVYDEAGNVIETHQHAGEFRNSLLIDNRAVSTMKAARKSDTFS